MYCVGVGVKGNAEAVGAVTFGNRPSNCDIRSSYTTAYLFSGSKDKTLKSHGRLVLLFANIIITRRRRNQRAIRVSNDEVQPVSFTIQIANQSMRKTANVLMRRTSIL